MAIEKMKRNFWAQWGWAAMGGLLALPQFALAQEIEVPEDAPPPLEARRPPGKPPEKPREDKRRQLENRLRGLMAKLGTDDEPTQDAVLQYLAEDEAGRQNVREAARRLMMGMRRDVPTERLSDLITGYKNALEADKTRRLQAQTSLDGKTGFSTKPNLEAMLWLIGVLGDAPPPNLPQILLAPNKPPAPPKPAPDEREGVAIGVVTDKAANWLEIRDDAGQIERYTATWKREYATPGNFDPQIVQAIAQTQNGDKVRIEWTWDERRRALKLEPMPQK